MGLFLQTIIIAHVLSTGRKGVSTGNISSGKSQVNNWQYKLALKRTFRNWHRYL